MNQERLALLMQRYADDTASAAELKELSDLIAQSPDNELFSEIVIDLANHNPLKSKQLSPYEDLADKALLQSRLRHPAPQLRRIPAWTWAAAACILLILSTGAWFLYKRPAESQTVKSTSAPKKIILPGKNGAVLTLADGSTVSLDSLGSGKIASQNGADIVIHHGKLAYTSTGIVSNEPAYNTLSTPKGRQFHFQLPDGTEVWLNAASSIHYPTAFNGKERIVQLTGEAYFEVAKNPAMPFKVNVGAQARIEVLGTHFNVNAYSNESLIRTTLLEGSVQFHSGIDRQPGDQMVTLGPGQQSQLDISTRKLAVENDVETDKVMAWKNGFFDFNDVSLRDAMNQLQRWYDIEVAYEKDVPPIHFFGKMTKNIPLNDLLLILEKSKVHFQIEERKLIVQP
jgi:transmembrane sensor